MVVVRPGLYTTIQDLGRAGFQHLGIPVAGAMDRFACRAANRLVGNADTAALLEATVSGPELVFEEEAVVAVTGGDLTPRLNAAPLPLWTAVSVPRGSVVSFGSRRTGARAYVVVAGGLAVPQVLGSRSTHAGSGLGGLHGRPLAAGDRLQAGRPACPLVDLVGRSWPERARPGYRASPDLRILPGPHAHLFDHAAWSAFTAARYRLSPSSDRMGFRLTGPEVAPLKTGEMLSEAVPFGAVQIPPDGRPILLMADRQTTGGYPVIAVVITADLPLAAQLMPGDSLGFNVVDLKTAHDLLAEQETWLDRIRVPHRGTQGPRAARSARSSAGRR